MPVRPLTADDLWTLPRVGAPVPRPDGEAFVVPVTTFDVKANHGTTRLWLVPSAARNAGTEAPGDPARPLTTGDGSSLGSAWRPDGRYLAFVRKPGGSKQEKSEKGPRFPDEPQLYVMPADGGEAERMTDMPLGVADPRWFPDGRRIAFLGVVYAGLESIPAVAEMKKQREDDPVKAYVTEDRVYRYWDRWLTDGKVHHLFVLDVETGEILDLTPDSRRHFPFMNPEGNYRISPDGKEIAFTACRTEPPYRPLAFGVFTVKVPAAVRPGRRPPAVRALAPDVTGNARRPVYSPDGKKILYGRTTDVEFYADRVQLVLHDRASGREDLIAEDWDRSPSAWEFSGDGKTVYAAADESGRRALVRIGLSRRGAGAPAELHRGGAFEEFTVAGGRIHFSQSSLAAPPEACSIAEDGTDFVRHTSFAAHLLKKFRLSKPVETTVAGADGRKVQVFLLPPPGEKMPGRGRGAPRWPLVHLIHGGPHHHFGDEWHWRWNAQAFAAPGRLAALVNFHGSTGFGQDFTQSILGRWGDQPYRDVEAVTDHLVARGLADPERMAVTGGSYGGYLVAWICSQTDRYACAVNHAGVSDFQIQYASDVTQGMRKSVGAPWEDLEAFDRYNPMRYAKGFQTPMLVLHGERDFRVPYGQGLAIYDVLVAKGVPARLVIYPDENHWVLKPRNSRHWYGEVNAWLDRWLLDRS